MALQRGDGPLRRIVPPELLDENRGGDDPAQPYQQERQERPATGGPRDTSCPPNWADMGPRTCSTGPEGAGDWGG